MSIAQAAPRSGAGTARWPALFSPGEIRGRRVRNRIVSTPHATGWGHDGVVTAAEVDYHVRKAAGGCGVVMTFGSASVDPDSAASYGSISLWDPRNDEALRALATRVHEHGALCLSQMTHMGRRGSSLVSGLPLRGASDVPEGVHREVPVVLAPEELAVIVRRFAEAARHLHDLGWDGVEVTSFGGHLIEQFFDPNINQRSDEYGGSLENRVRFAREILTAVRAATSEHFIVGFRVTADQHLPGGMTQQDLRDVVSAVAAGGLVDLLSVSGGTGATERSSSFFVPADEVPVNANGSLAGVMGATTGLPVIAAGRILDADTAEHALTEQGVDFVAMTRALIADPDLPRKLADGESPRPCISLSEGCIGRLYSGMPMACSINPAIRSPELDDTADAAAAESGRHVVVIGGGVAGAEAARKAARRGHRVTLLESGPALGGRARTAGSRRGRERWALYLDWLAAELEAEGVQVRLGADLDTAAIAGLAPDEVVVATGSQLRRTRFHDDPALGVTAADDVVTSPPRPRGGGRATVVDDEGGFSAPTAAEALVAAGWTVRIVTDLPYVAAKVDPTQVWFVRRRLKQAGIELLAQVEVARRDDGWHLVDRESDAESPAGPIDLLVLAGHRIARHDVVPALRDALPDVPIRRVGDALAPRTLLDAVAEGATAGATVPSTARA